MSSIGGGGAVANPALEPQPLTIPTASVPVTKAGLYVWVESRAEWVPVQGYPSPTHLSAAVLEASGPQEFVSSSHPAAGSTASVTITNPGVQNTRALIIVGYNFTLAQGTASAGQVNNGNISGSAGGQYTGEGLAIGTGTDVVDRVVVTGRTFVSGNATLGNITENFTLTFGLAGIANLFQQVHVWWRYAV